MLRFLATAAVLLAAAAATPADPLPRAGGGLAHKTGVILTVKTGQQLPRGTLSRDGRYLFGGADGEPVRAYDLQNKMKVVREYAAGSGEVRPVLSKDDGLIAYPAPGTKFARGEATVFVYDAASGNRVHALALTPKQAGNECTVTGLAFDPAGTALWTASSDGTVRRFDLTIGKQDREFTTADGDRACQCLAVAPGGGRLVCAGRDGYLRYLDAATGTVVRSLDVPRSAVTGNPILGIPFTAVAVSADGESAVATSPREGVWHFSPGERKARQVVTTGANERVGSVVLSLNGELIVYESGGERHFALTVLAIGKAKAAPPPLPKQARATTLLAATATGDRLLLADDPRTQYVQFGLPAARR